MTAAEAGGQPDTKKSQVAQPPLMLLRQEEDLGGCDDGGMECCFTQLQLCQWVISCAVGRTSCCIVTVVAAVHLFIFQGRWLPVTIMLLPTVLGLVVVNQLRSRLSCGMPAFGILCCCRPFSSR